MVQYQTQMNAVRTSDVETVDVRAAALAPTRIFVLVDGDLVVRATGGDGVDCMGSICGMRLPDVLGARDAGFEATIARVIAGAAATTHALDVPIADTVTRLDVEISGLVDQSGQRLAAMWTEIGSNRHTSPSDRLSLSEREGEILELVADGLRVATIARHLYISPSTVRNHLSSIFRKAGVKNQAELLEWLRAVPHATADPVIDDSDDGIEAFAAIDGER